ncbi:mitochondrial import receptor subunit TOM40 homolog isoform X2 [Equus asinus]|uniref:mitochondrial import receptor subunit TOM40 homolog isoform X2 n=1 Tax=Equus asinus TaxID=9793 RepID=UPI0038F755A1
MMGCEHLFMMGRSELSEASGRTEVPGQASESMTVSEGEKGLGSSTPGPRGPGWGLTQVNHTVALSTIGESNYHFGVTYVGTKQLSPTEAFPVLVGDMDNSGSLNAQVIHQLGPGFRSKMAIQTQQSKFVNWQVDGEYRGSDFTAVVTLGNPDVLVGSGVLVAHYLQSITPCLALGGELVYHRRPGEEGTVMSLAGKYTLNNWLATITLGQAGMHATYYHKASDQLQVGVEFEASMRMQDTSVSFGYQLGLPKAHLLFKGTGLSPIADSGREGTQL